MPHIDVYLLDQVVRMVAGNMATGHLYSRLIPLVLLLVDGNVHLSSISNLVYITKKKIVLYIVYTTTLHDA